jgi:N-acetyl-gamma-glutamyl-phosphate reductase
MTTQIKVSIIGATGYTGSELLRLFLYHPHAEIAYLTSRQHEKVAVGEVFPRLQHVSGLFITNTEYDTVAAESDVVFLCLPHVASQEVIDQFKGKTKVIDMSADFRLSDSATFERYYDTPHLKPELLGGAFVYGLPELNREALREADLVANPGCNALLVQMMLLPFAGKINHADVSLFTGTTGGGRSPRDPIDHPALSGNVRSYQVNAHRHTPEILRTAQLDEAAFNFTPTVGPYLRGIFATAFVDTDATPDLSHFEGSPFVRVSDKVELNNVISTNFCDLSFLKARGGRYIVQGAIDNLLRGAAGTAVQNMNIMFGFAEDAGLKLSTPVWP